MGVRITTVARPLLAQLQAVRRLLTYFRPCFASTTPARLLQMGLQSELSGTQPPITVFYSQGPSQSRLTSTNKRRRHGGKRSKPEEGELPNKKTKLKENREPASRRNDLVDSSALKTNELPTRQLVPPRPKAAVLQAGSSAIPQESDLASVDGELTDKTASAAHPTVPDTPPRPRRRLKAPFFLPTPATSVKHSLSIPTNSGPTPAGKGFIHRSTLRHGTLTTPTEVASRADIQLPTPMTPTRQRSTAKPPLISSPLSSPPPSPDAVASMKQSKIAATSQTIVPSSQTQTLEFSHFLLLPDSRANDASRGAFKVPSFHHRTATAHPSTRTDRISSSEEPCLIPSSQSQDLTTFFAPFSIISRQQSGLENIKNIDLARSERMPGSAAVKPEFRLPPVPARRRKVIEKWSTLSDHDDTEVADRKQEQGWVTRSRSSSTHGDTVPTSQYLLEKEISSSDFIDMPKLSDTFATSSSQRHTSKDSRYVYPMLC